MQNFPPNNKLVSVPGYYVTFWFIEDWKVSSIPDPVNGTVNFANIIYTGEYSWYQGHGVFKTLQFGNEAKETTSGIEYPVKLEASWHNSPETTNLFVQKAYDRFVIIIKDYYGRFRIIGQPKNGLQFLFKESNKWTEFVYQANYDTPSYYITSVTLDPTPPPDPGGEGGGIVTIKRVDGTTIATVTAPAEYPVANTNAVLKNSGGVTLSTTVIKPAGAPQEIPAPDAVVNLRDTAGALLDVVNAKSGEPSDVEAPDATVNLVNTDSEVIGSSAVKSGETKAVPVPDTRVIAKNSLAEIIDDVYVASGTDAELNIGDSAVNIKDSAGALIETKTAPAETVVETTIPDSSVEITNTLDEVIATVNVKANGSTTEQIDDSNLTLNGAAWTDVPAKSSKDFALVDENGATIPGVGTSTQIQVPLNYNEFEIYFIRQSLINTGNY